MTLQRPSQTLYTNSSILSLAWWACRGPGKTRTSSSWGAGHACPALVGLAVPRLPFSSSRGPRSASSAVSVSLFLAGAPGPCANPGFCEKTSSWYLHTLRLQLGGRLGVSAPGGRGLPVAVDRPPGDRPRWWPLPPAAEHPDLCILCAGRGANTRPT